MARLGGGEAERLPQPEMEIGEPQLLTAGARELEVQRTSSPGPRLKNAWWLPRSVQTWGGSGCSSSTSARGSRASERHGDGDALALDQTIRRHLAAELPRPGGRLRAPPDGERDDQGHRHDHELGAAGENAEEERPADERDEGEVQGGRTGAHDGSVAGAGT